MCFKVWEEGFEDGNKMVEKRILLLEKTKHVQLIYLCLCFTTFSSYPTIGKEYNQ
jgi:hypothetical protein